MLVCVWAKLWEIETNFTMPYHHRENLELIFLALLFILLIAIKLLELGIFSIVVFVLKSKSNGSRKFCNKRTPHEAIASARWKVRHEWMNEKKDIKTTSIEYIDWLGLEKWAKKKNCKKRQQKALILCPFPLVFLSRSFCCCQAFYTCTYRSRLLLFMICNVKMC